MSQQINLFNPIFRRKGFSFTSATAMLYGIGIAIAFAALVAVFQDYRMGEVQNQAQAVDQAHKDASARLEKLNVEQAARKRNAQLEAEVARLETQLKSRLEVSETLNSGTVGNTGGFSEYMRAFSRQSVAGLWLTGFDIALAGDELAIRGRTLSPDLVASYLRRLNQEKALQGRQFAALRISQPPPEFVVQPKTPQQADQDAKGQKDTKQQIAAAPRYLDFSISTSGPVETGQRGSATATSPVATADVLEAAVRASGRTEAAK